MSKHTEGPWRYWQQKRTVSEDTCTFKNLKGEEILRAVTATISEADACLIAAAPELLSALVDCRRELYACARQLRSEGYIIGKTVNGPLNEATLAIARATRAV